jgi:hypothetical protein
MKPTRYTVTIALRAFGSDCEELRERIERTLGTHPTLSLRVDSIAVAEDWSQLEASKPENAPPWAFWWESNHLHGWVCHPDAWATVKAAYPDIEDLAERAKQAAWEHPMVAIQASGADSYGLRREHTGSRSLADHGREHGLAWLAAPIVAYDRDNPPRLPASAFKPGDRVRGKDEGGWHTGKVSNRFAERHAREGDVLVWFDGEEYEPGAVGNLVKAELLMLWPAAAHRTRLLEVSTGADLDRAGAGCLRKPGEDDAAYRERALAFVVFGIEE